MLKYIYIAEGGEKADYHYAITDCFNINRNMV